MRVFFLCFLALRLSSPLSAQLIANHVTPEMFGARGDGITDDSTPIQQAINEVSKTDKLLYFSAKVYLLKNVKIPDNVSIEGNNTVIKLTDSAMASVFSNADTINGNKNISIINIEIDGNKAHQPKTKGINSVAIDFTNCDNVRIANVKIHDIRQTLYVYPHSEGAIHFDKCTNSSITGIELWNTDKEGIYLICCNNILVKNNWLHDIGYSAIGANNACGNNKNGSLKIDGNRIFNTGATNISLNVPDSWVTNNYCDSTLKYNNIVVGHVGANSNADNAVITNNMCYRSINGIGISNGSNILIQKNIIKHQRGSGIFFSNSLMKRDNILIKDNILDSINSTGTHPYIGVGIWAWLSQNTSMKNLRIENNRISNCQSQSVRIRNVYNARIVNNELKDNCDKAITNSGATSISIANTESLIFSKNTIKESRRNKIGGIFSFSGTNKNTTISNNLFPPGYPQTLRKIKFKDNNTDSSHMDTSTR